MITATFPAGPVGISLEDPILEVIGGRTVEDHLPNWREGSAEGLRQGPDPLRAMASWADSARSKRDIDVTLSAKVGDESDSDLVRVVVAGPIPDICEDLECEARIRG